MTISENRLNWMKIYTLKTKKIGRELVGHKRSIQISLSKYLFCLLMVMILGTLSFALHFQRSSDFNLKEGATDITMWLYLCLHKKIEFLKDLL